MHCHVLPEPRTSLIQIGSPLKCHLLHLPPTSRESRKKGSKGWMLPRHTHTHKHTLWTHVIMHGGLAFDPIHLFSREKRWMLARHTHTLDSCSYACQFGLVINRHYKPKPCITTPKVCMGSTKMLHAGILHNQTHLQEANGQSSKKKKHEKRSMLYFCTACNNNYGHI